MNAIIKSSAGRIADTYDFVLSTEDRDRHGDIVMQDGIDTGAFLKNPVALFQHDHSLPVGVWSNLRRAAGATVGTLSLVAKGTSRAGDLARSLLEQGILKAVSISFVGKEKAELEPRGWRFIKSELLEVSLVSVGANPNALLVAKSLNFTDEEIKKYLPEVAPVGSIDPDELASQLARRNALQKRAVDAIYHAKQTIRTMR